MTGYAGPARCATPSCRHPVDFAVNVKGTGRMPINHDSAGDPAGNLEVWRDSGGQLRYRYLAEGEEPAAGRKRGVSHFATCPARDQWRRRNQEDPAHATAAARPGPPPP